MRVLLTATWREQSQNENAFVVAYSIVICGSLLGLS